MADLTLESSPETEIPVSGNSDADRRLFKTLDSHHPDYDEWLENWKVYRDTSGEAEPNKEDYLPKNKLEPGDQYAFRRDISHWCPESARANNKIVSALYQSKPKRTIADKQITEFIDNSDGRGNGFNAVMAKIMLQLLAYGVTRILVNVPPVSGKKPGSSLTEAEAQQAGLRPRVIIYNPLNVIDWDVDGLGVLNMIRIRETQIRKLNPQDPESPNVFITRFIHFDREWARWWEFQGEKDRETIVPNGTGSNQHGLGMVPMVVRYWPQEMKPMIGASFIRYMSKLDVSKFQSESDREYATYLHAHPQLKIWCNESPSKRNLGVSTWLHFLPGDATQGREDAEYVQAPLAAFDAIDRAIENKLSAIYRHSGADPMGVIARSTSKVFESSGISRAWSFATSEALLLSDLADAAVEIEWAVLKLVSRWLGKENFDGEIQYPEEFDLSSVGTLIDETAAITQMINSPTLAKYRFKRIAAVSMGDASAELLDKVNKEIESRPLFGVPAGRDVTDRPTIDMGMGVEDDEEEPESEPPAKKPTSRLNTTTNASQGGANNQPKKPTRK
jgi:hypothetical protein